MEQVINDMKVLFIGPLPPPLGGVAVMNSSIQELLSDKFKIIPFNTSKGGLQEDLYNKNLIKKLFPQLKKFYLFFNFVRKNSDAEITNIFVTSGMGFIREALFITILKIFRKKIIVHFHSKKKGEFFLSSNRIKILSFFLNKCEKIILLSEDHKEYFKKYFHKNKLEIVENFVDYKLYDCDINDKKEEFLYVGRLSEKKGFYDLLEAVKKLKEKHNFEIIFNIIGLAENENEHNKIVQLIKKYKLENLIILCGAKFGDEKYELFKKCKYFIFPSHFENSPVVLKEAIASKMFIFSSDIFANKNVLNIIKENIIYFEKNNPNSISEKIHTNISKTKNLQSLESNPNFYNYDKSIAKDSLIRIHKGLI